MAEWAREAGDGAGSAPRRLSAWVDSLIELEDARWFLWLPVMFGIGIAFYFAAASEPSGVVLGAIFVVAATLWWLVNPPAALLVSTAIVAIAAGAFAAKLRTEIVRAPVLAASTSTVTLTGWIERVEPRTSSGQRLTLRVVSLGALARDQLPHRVRVRTTVKDPTLAPGNAVRLRASLGPPPQPAAPQDFDFGRLAFYAGLGGFGVAFGGVERITLDAPMPWSLRLQTPVERLRQIIRERIVAALPGEAGEIATALITGERGGITEETNQAYRNAGLFHILSISGLHMVIMAGAVFYLLRLCFAAIPSIALRRPIKAWAALGAIIGAFAYLMISGAAFATVRSWIMITIIFAAVMADRPALALRNVALAALLILVLWPESLFDAGFQMSFAAVVGLVAAYEWLRRRRQNRADRTLAVGPVRQAARFVGEIVLSTVVASVVVAPFGIYHFHNTQMLAMIANVLAIPVCNLIVMPAALGVLLALPFGLEAAPLWLMGQGVEAMSIVARWVGALPGAVVKVSAIPTAAFALIVAGGLWLLLFASRIRVLGFIPLAAGLALAPSMPRPDVLISRDGATVAVRGADGRLSALAVRAQSFDLARWLERDGDARPADVVARASAFTCDAVGCVARVRSRIVTVAMSLAALDDDCRAADVLIVRGAAPRGCLGTAKTGLLLLDTANTSAAGAHALYLDGDRIRVDTVAHMRGIRPWSAGRALLPEPDPGDRTAGFTALFERFRTP